MSRRGIVAWSVAGFAIGSTVAAEVLRRFFWVDSSEDALFVPVIVGGTAMCVVGALIESRTANPLGWLLLAVPATTGLSLLAGVISDHGIPSGARYAPLAYWFSQWPFFASLILLIAIFYLFPTGRLPSRRWRWPWRVYMASGVVTVVGLALLPYTERFDGGVVTNPVGLDPLEPVLSTLLAAAGLALVVSSFCAFASLVARYRRAEADERQQLRWLFLVAAVGAVLFVALLATVSVGGDKETGVAQAFADVLMAILVTDIVVGIPIATGIAIFRYHLYDLNLVVRRTLVVAAMAVAITALYVGTVVAVPLVVRGAGAEGGFDPLPLVAAAAIALLFDPLRRWARRLADRVVFGDRATPYEVLTAFGERVDKGLGAALEAQARKAAVPTTVDNDEIGRFPQKVEAAVYFSVLECLNNVAKYADASKADISLGRSNGHLTFEVRDDGRGFDPSVNGYGTGLQGMADRLEAVGGTLEVRSAPRAGTTVSGSIPATTVEAP